MNSTQIDVADVFVGGLYRIVDNSAYAHCYTEGTVVRATTPSQDSGDGHQAVEVTGPGSASGTTVPQTVALGDLQPLSDDTEFVVTGEHPRFIEQGLTGARVTLVNRRPDSDGDLMVRRVDGSRLSYWAKPSTLALPDTDPEPVRLTDDERRQFEDRIANMEENVQAAHRGRRESERNHAEDVARIGAALIEYAENNSLCSEYDSWVADLNSGLHVLLPVRTRTYEIEVLLTRTQKQIVTVEVEAADEDDARDSFDESEAWSQADYGSWEDGGDDETEIIDVTVQ